MHHRRCSQPGLQHQRQVQSPSHLQPPECRLQRQHTCGCVLCRTELLVCQRLRSPFWKSRHVSCRPSGRFTHAILQPVLGNRKSTCALDAGMDSAAENSGTGWVFRSSGKINSRPGLLSVQLFLFWLQNLCCSWREDVWQSAGQKAEEAGGARPNVPPGEEQRRSGLSLCGSW